MTKPIAFNTLPASAAPWPYPFWIAHRGAGKIAPENTLAAFNVGAAHGYRMFECDVKLSADEVCFLLHDDTLDRTTNGKGTGGQLPWSELSQLDAGRWHSRSYAGEALPTLANIAHFCLANHLLLNIEIKPTPGTERLTGERVATAAAHLWKGQEVAPLLTSFQVEALEGAQAKQPDLPRGLLLENLTGDWLATATRLACVAVVCEHSHLTPDAITQIHAHGMKALCYTANEQWAIDRLLAMGIDGIITDNVALFAPANHP
jgi:glycerophosphoryl diester phosphodiesterase